MKNVLSNRSDGSIEFKHQNISAALIKHGLPFIKGYKPKWNYQKILEEKILDYLQNKRLNIEPSFVHFADLSVGLAKEINFNNLIESPPIRQNLAMEPTIEDERNPIKINYLQREQANSMLGRRGEELIYDYEKWRLVNLGKENLADKIKWISQSDDGAGFDILSKNENGSDRYIEVKTTKLSKETPIFFSKNEYDFSIKRASEFYLYRLFNFNDHPKMFSFNGSFDTFCSKVPLQYKGYF